jgi:hypothetical protein
LRACDERGKEGTLENITATEFALKVRSLLPSEVRRASGKSLYSAARTLCRGNVYVLGINPGGDPEALATNTIEPRSTSLASKGSTSTLTGAGERKSLVMGRSKRGFDG